MDFLVLVVNSVQDLWKTFHLAVTRDEPAPVIEYMTPAVEEYVSPAFTYTAPSPVTECVASTPADMLDKLFPVDELVPLERLQQQTVEVPMPQILKVTVGLDELATFERVQQQTVDVPMPQILKEADEVSELAPFERGQQQTVDVPMPQILKEADDVGELAPFERMQQQTIVMPMPQILQKDCRNCRIGPVCTGATASCRNANVSDFERDSRGD